MTDDKTSITMDTLRTLAEVGDGFMDGPPCADRACANPFHAHLTIPLMDGREVPLAYFDDDRAPEPDPEIEIFEGCEAIDAGKARGLAFRLAETQDEIDAYMASLSPCGIHLHRFPVAVCPRCGGAS